VEIVFPLAGTTFELCVGSTKLSITVQIREFSHTVTFEMATGRHAALARRILRRYYFPKASFHLKHNFLSPESAPVDWPYLLLDTNLGIQAGTRK